MDCVLLRQHRTSDSQLHTLNLKLILQIWMWCTINKFLWVKVYDFVSLKMNTLRAKQNIHSDLWTQFGCLFEFLVLAYIFVQAPSYWQLTCFYHSGCAAIQQSLHGDCCAAAQRSLHGDCWMTVHCDNPSINNQQDASSIKNFIFSWNM